jgi:hypothetical protein
MNLQEKLKLYSSLHNELDQKLVRAWNQFNKRAYKEFNGYRLDSSSSSFSCKRLPLTITHFEIFSESIIIYSETTVNRSYKIPLQVLETDDIEENVDLYIEEQTLLEM